MSFLLNLMDGLEDCEGFLLIATSNHPEKIDAALLQRPSRFDRLWNFGLPGFDERARMMRLRGRDAFSETAIAEAAQASEACSMAMVQEMVVNAMLGALHEGRKPTDADLLGSVRRIKEQYHQSQRVSGDLPTARVGFHANAEEDL